jgi:hypothetical protein
MYIYLLIHTHKAREREREREKERDTATSTATDRSLTLEDGSIDDHCHAAVPVTSRARNVFVLGWSVRRPTRRFSSTPTPQAPEEQI